MMDVTRDQESMLIPLVCRSCSQVQHVPLALLRTAKDIRCDACGAAWDASAISATVPAGIVSVEARRASAPRPLSEFP